MSNIQLPDTFNAMAITQYGGVEYLQSIEKPLVLPQQSQVLVKVISASVNPIDVKTRAGLGLVAAKNADKLPMVAGYDCYGVIVAIGDKVNDLCCGDLVTGMVGFPLDAGCYAQYVLAEDNHLVKVAADTTLDIAGLPLAGLTAYQGLFEFGNLEAGQTILISGAAGGVGQLAVQLAVLKGATVIAVASEKNHAMLMALGAQRVIDYNELSQFENVGKIDLWFDLVGGDAAVSQMALVSHIVSVVTVPTLSAEKICNMLMPKGTLAQGMLVKPDHVQLTKLVDLVEKGQLRLNISKQLDLSQASYAHTLVEQGKVSGKIILTIQH